MSFGIQLKLTHTGQSGSSIFIDDVHQWAIRRGTGVILEPTYVPVNQVIYLTYGSLVPTSFELGDIRKYIDQGDLLAEFIFGTGTGGPFIPVAEKGVANGVATLDATTKIPLAQIPKGALPEVYVVADAAARLALTVEEGDEAIQLDDGSQWIYDGAIWHIRVNPNYVVGPASATHQAITRYDGITGKLVQDSLVLIDDAGNITLPALATVDGRDISTDGIVLDRVNESMIVSKESTGFLNRTDSQIGLAGLVFSIQPTGASYDYYSYGTKYTKFGVDSVTLPNVTDTYYIYFDGTTLTYTTTFDPRLSLGPWVFVGELCWNATDGKNLHVNDERHGLIMDGRTQQYLHNTRGIVWGQGLDISYTLGDGSLNTHAEVALSDGDVWHEDIQFVLVDDNPQDLDPIAQLPVWRRQGVSWTKDIANNFPVKQGVNRIQWNSVAGPNWGLTEAQEGYFVAMWVFATNGIYEPAFVVLGQREDDTLSNAQNNTTFGALDLTGFHTLGSKLLYRLIFETQTGYANTPSARLREIRDFRNIPNWQITGQGDHNSLTGRGVANAHPATAVSANTVGFNNVLGVGDTDVQLALDTIDDHVIADHRDTSATGAQLNTLVGGGPTTLHKHAATGINTNTANFDNILGVGDTTTQAALDTLDDHTIAAHSDTMATGAQLNTLTGGGVTALHLHAYLKYPPTAVDPAGPPAPADGDLYYNTALDMLMKYDSGRGKWLSVDSVTLYVGRQGNTPPGSYYQGVGGLTGAATTGFTAPYNGTLVALGYTRTDNDAATFEVTDDGASLGVLASAALKGKTVALNNDFAVDSVLAMRNQAAGNTTTNVQAWFKVRWRV